MGTEIDLMKNYPKTKRDPFARLKSKTDQHRKVAREFGREFFDGTRDTGYGGFTYDAKYWAPVIPDFSSHFGIKNNDSILDVGCAKGFMLYDFLNSEPTLKVSGIDISEYAIKHSHPKVKEFLQIGDCRELPFEDNSFDFSFSITTIHNVDKKECIQSLSEIERVTKKGSFITVDAYNDETEKKAMFAWNLTAKTILHVDEWKNLFDIAGYTGDFFWFLP